MIAFVRNRYHKSRRKNAKKPEQYPTSPEEFAIGIKSDLAKQRLRQKRRSAPYIHARKEIDPLAQFIAESVLCIRHGRISLQPKENVIEKNVSACLSAR